MTIPLTVLLTRNLNVDFLRNFKPAQNLFGHSLQNIQNVNQVRKAVLSCSKGMT